MLRAEGCSVTGGRADSSASLELGERVGARRAVSRPSNAQRSTIAADRGRASSPRERKAAEHAKSARPTRRQAADSRESGTARTRRLHVVLGRRREARATRSRSRMRIRKYSSSSREFLRTHFGVPTTSMRVACNLFADHLERQQEIEDVLARAARLATIVPAQVDRQHLLEVHARRSARTSSRSGPARSRGAQHAHRADDLRLHPGVRRLRAAGVARLARRAQPLAPLRLGVDLRAEQQRHALSHSHVSITITAESVPHVLLYDPNVAV